MDSHEEAPEEQLGWQYVLADEGCHLWDSCLSCALPKCKDDVGEARAVAAARAAGVSVMARGKIREHRAGRVTETRGPTRPRYLPADTVARIQELFREGVSKKGISKRLGIAISTVGRHAAKEGTLATAK